MPFIVPTSKKIKPRRFYEIKKDIRCLIKALLTKSEYDEYSCIIHLFVYLLGNITVSKIPKYDDLLQIILPSKYTNRCII